MCVDVLIHCVGGGKATHVNLIPDHLVDKQPIKLLSSLPLSNSFFIFNTSLVIPDTLYNPSRPSPDGDREGVIIQLLECVLVVQYIPLFSTSSMQLLMTTGTLVPCILTRVVSSTENTLFTISRDGWQSRPVSLRHCLCTLYPQSAGKAKSSCHTR